MDLRKQVKHIFKMCGHAINITVHERLNALEQQTAESQAALLRSSIHTVETLHEIARRQAADPNRHRLVETNSGAPADPEAGLIAFLYSYLPVQKALDIGASSPSESMLDAGYEVYAFEPDAASKIIPKDIGLVRISKGGLEAIRRMGGVHYPVIVTGFWDKEAPFRSSDSCTIEELVEEIRPRGYRWHIVLYQTQGHQETGFYSNHRGSVPGSWGKIFFFHDYSTFEKAQEWCAAVLSKTYFKPTRT